MCGKAAGVVDLAARYDESHVHGIYLPRGCVTEATARVLESEATDG
jgi:hypothetical protein